MEIRIRHEAVSADEFNSLCRSVGWKSIAEENYNLAVANSIACVSAFSGAEAVGCGRLVGDVGMYLYIQDVIVRGDLHGRGVGAQIVDELHRIAEQLDCRRDKVGLIAAVDVCDFYTKLGYAESAPVSKFLVKPLGPVAEARA